MMPWTVYESLKRADQSADNALSLSGDVCALQSLAAEVRRLNIALAYAKDGLGRAATAIEKSLYDEALLYCGHHETWAANALRGKP